MQTLSSACVFEKEIKKSRFIAHAAPVSHPERAMAFLKQVSQRKATHNCWAYRIDGQGRFSDDGEPGGTAGRPILGALEKQDIDGAMVVVIRYFGGIKLGAGGLVRAYGGVAAACLQQARRIPIRKQMEVEITVPFDAMGRLYPVLDAFGVQNRHEAYDETGLILTASIESGQQTAFARRLADDFRGAVDWRVLPS